MSGINRRPSIEREGMALYEKTSKADLIELYVDLYRQTHGDERTAQEWIADLTRRLGILKFHRGATPTLPPVRRISFLCEADEHIDCDARTSNGSPCECSCHKVDEAEMQRRAAADKWIAEHPADWSNERGPESWYQREPAESATPAPAPTPLKVCVECGITHRNGGNLCTDCADPRHNAPAPKTNGALALAPLPAQPTPAEEIALCQAQPAPTPLHADTFVPSAYQAGIFDFVEHGEGDGIVNAVAGSGKTTTLIQAAKLLTVPALFVAFNKHIVEELQGKLARTQMTAKTMHAIGYGCVSKALGQVKKPNEYKYHDICQKHVAREIVPQPGPEQQKAATALRDLCRFARLTLTDPNDRDALIALIDHHGIEIDPAIPHLILDAVPDVLREGERIARSEKLIDFTDMIWLPHVWKLQPPQMPWIFVDEAQDLNAAQLDLCVKCRAPGGRMLFVGDPSQAIYGFAGADAQSFYNIKVRTGARELPLSICYRCPTSHLDLARQIVPQIEAREDAPEGAVSHIRANELATHVQVGDLLLCRLTAPLVSECLRLIGQHVAARVRGRDIGKQLADLIGAVQQMPSYQGWDTFGDTLGDYEATQRMKLLQREHSESQIEALSDRCEAIRVCYESFHAASADALRADIEGLFSDDKAAVNLSTIHRAKGLEEERVLILRPDKLPLSWPKQRGWEAEQEQNLRYVAYTRAKRELVFVEA